MGSPPISFLLLPNTPDAQFAFEWRKLNPREKKSYKSYNPMMSTWQPASNFDRGSRVGIHSPFQPSTSASDTEFLLLLHVVAAWCLRMDDTQSGIKLQLRLRCLRCHTDIKLVKFSKHDWISRLGLQGISLLNHVATVVLVQYSEP